jgi:hypothetical protein
VVLTWCGGGVQHACTVNMMLAGGGDYVSVKVYSNGKTQVPALRPALRFALPSEQTRKSGSHSALPSEAGPCSPPPAAPCHPPLAHFLSLSLSSTRVARHGPAAAPSPARRKTAVRLSLRRKTAVRLSLRRKTAVRLSLRRKTAVRLSLRRKTARLYCPREGIASVPDERGHGLGRQRPHDSGPTAKGKGQRLRFGV